MSGLEKLAAQTGLRLSRRVSACHFGKRRSSQRARAQGNGTRGGIWTLAPIYRLEAGVIKRPLSGIQMRNLVCNPTTRQNDNVCFLVIVRRDQSGPLWPTPRLMEAVLSGQVGEPTVTVLSECFFFSSSGKDRVEGSFGKVWWTVGTVDYIGRRGEKK